jgi:hypothetical protein
VEEVAPKEDEVHVVLFRPEEDLWDREGGRGREARRKGRG